MVDFECNLLYSCLFKIHILLFRRYLVTLDLLRDLALYSNVTSNSCPNCVDSLQNCGERNADFNDDENNHCYKYKNPLVIQWNSQWHFNSNRPEWHPEALHPKIWSIITMLFHCPLDCKLTVRLLSFVSIAPANVPTAVSHLNRSNGLAILPFLCCWYCLWKCRAVNVNCQRRGKPCQPWELVPITTGKCQMCRHDWKKKKKQQS